jgi:hypothetical protein
VLLAPLGADGILAGLPSRSHVTQDTGAPNAAWRRIVMSDACLTGMAFGLWRTTLRQG